ncbi:hypothetical protein [Kitasatospora purpeofusca]|uniref:hypothetical protein n=1 Tax=Kitasatospora purpeofusca TaxID=67352 RepID=UPI002A5AF283|nr:hypothetical protein [Kitasatospora purpeofusca]MDY0811078.1 hypothetical protein [Kitasatospora purpeofusca]
MALHPLAVLRTSIGLSHPAYARLVARTHAELGFGQMAARREKVSRWESGRIAPETTAQLAIAHIHDIPQDDVLRLGWPHWLLPATGDTSLLTRPWTADGAIAAINSLPLAAGPCAAHLTVTGPVLAAQIRAALTCLSDAPRSCSASGHPALAKTLAWTGTRLRALEALEAGTPIPVAALHTAAEAEYDLITPLLTAHGPDSPDGSRLLLLAARAAALRAWLCGAQGEETWAERYALAALRAAAAAGSRRHTAAYLSQLAVRHLRFGDPGDALALMAAARTVLPRPAPRLAAALESREARSLAAFGDAGEAVRALERAGRALRGAPPWHTDAQPSCAAVDERYLALAHGNTWLLLGRAERALAYFESAPDAAPAHRSPHLGERLRAVVVARLELGDADAAATDIDHALALVGRLSPCLQEWFGERLAPHAHRPAVAGTLTRLSPPARMPLQEALPER